MRARAVVSVYNEEVLLPHFLRHYARFCDSIVVWDNGSTDASRELAKAHPLVELREFQTDGYDEMGMLGVLAQTKVESRGRFDWILFPDCDEFILSRKPGLERAVLEAADGDVLRPKGFCLVQGPKEGPLVADRHVLSQRSFGRPCGGYSKPVIMRPEARVRFDPGKHSVTEIGPCVLTDAPGLALVHCEMIDFELYVYRKNRRALSDANKANGWCVKRFCQPEHVHRRLWDEAFAASNDLRGEIPVLGGAA